MDDWGDVLAVAEFVMTDHQVGHVGTVESGREVIHSEKGMHDPSWTRS